MRPVDSGPSVPLRTWRFKSSHPHWFFLGLLSPCSQTSAPLRLVGTNWERVALHWFASLASSDFPREESGHGQLEQRGKSYRIIFRFEGSATPARSAPRANASPSPRLRRWEDNLQRAQRWILRIPGFHWGLFMFQFGVVHSCLPISIVAFHNEDESMRLLPVMLIGLVGCSTTVSDTGASTDAPSVANAPFPADIQSWAKELEVDYSEPALDLRLSNITDDGLEHIKGLTALRKLNLESTKITDGGLEQLKGMHFLTWLNLCSTEITDAGLLNVGRLSDMKELDLHHEDYGRRPPDGHLHGLTELNDLWLMNTDVTDAGVATLQQSLPNCKVHR